MMDFFMFLKYLIITSMYGVSSYFLGKAAFPHDSGGGWSLTLVVFYILVTLQEISDKTGGNNGTKI